MPTNFHSLENLLTINGPLMRWRIMNPGVFELDQIKSSDNNLISQTKENKLLKNT